MSSYPVNSEMMHSQHSFPGSNESDYNYLLLIRKSGDFTPFYIAIAIASVIFAVLLILNLTFCCCSEHSGYWKSPHTGNRWVISLWSSTPHNQPPLDLSELESNRIIETNTEPHRNIHIEEIGPSTSRQPLTSSQEYLELHKRESDI